MRRLTPPPSSIPPPRTASVEKPTRHGPRDSDKAMADRPSYTPGPLQDRGASPSRASPAPAPPRGSATRLRAPSTSKAVGKSGKSRRATRMVSPTVPPEDSRVGTKSDRQPTPLKDREFTLPPPTMSPPPLPGLSPPPPLEAGRKSLQKFQQGASAVSEANSKPKSATSAGQSGDAAPQTNYFRSETPSEMAAGLDGRTALAVAETALERALSGREPVTASHFHKILAALAQVAHEVCSAPPFCLYGASFVFIEHCYTQAYAYGLRQPTPCSCLKNYCCVPVYAAACILLRGHLSPLGVLASILLIAAAHLR